jgi:hypothetical protein
LLFLLPAALLLLLQPSLLDPSCVLSAGVWTKTAAGFGARSGVEGGRPPEHAHALILLLGDCRHRHEEHCQQDRSADECAAHVASEHPTNVSL